MCALQTNLSRVIFRFELILNPVHGHFGYLMNRFCFLTVLSSLNSELLCLAEHGMDQAGNADIRKFKI